MENQKIILFYNTMFGKPLRYPEDEIPEQYILTADRRFMDLAAAVVFHLPSISPDCILSLRPGKNKRQLWVAWFMECEAHYPYISDPQFMSHFDLMMSYHPDSDIAVTYVRYNFGELLQLPVYEKDADHIVTAFISSPLNKSGRVQFLMKLMSVINVDSYGTLLQTKTVINDYGPQFKMDTITKYKFTIAFENAIARDYVTEKFYDPLIAGSVPVYLGASNIDDFAPGKNSFINASGWDSPESLGNYLLEVSRDDALYRSYFEWREKSFSPSFNRLLEQQKEHEFVRLCKKVDEIL